MNKKKHFTQAMLHAHTWVGLVFGALIYIVCVSGTLAVLVDEFAQWEAPDAPTVQQADPALLARIATVAYERARAEKLDHDLMVLAPTPELPWIRVTAFGEGEPHQSKQWVADAQARLHPMPSAPWTEFVRLHHHQLHLPAPIGLYVVGIIGTLLLASLGAGVLAHRRILRDAFRLRWGGTRRLSNADLHNRIGVWALPFHLIVSLTGSLLGLAGMIVALLAFVAYQGDQDKAIAALLGPQPTDSHLAAPLPDVLPMIRQIESRTPNAEVTMLLYQHVGTAGQTVNITTAEAAHLSRNEGWSFNGEGRFLAKAGFTDGTVGMRIYGMVQPLHYGTYGGIPLKLIYVVLGTGLCVVAAAGINMWLARQRESGRPAPRTEKLWTALVWGQIAAYALAALVPTWAAQLSGQAVSSTMPLATYWLSTLGLCGLSLLAPDDQRAGRGLRLLGGALVAVLAIWHLLAWPGQSALGVALDMAFLVGAVLACLPWRKARRGAPVFT